MIKEIKPRILINCAGYITTSNLSELSTEEWRKHLDINVTGSFLCSKYAIQNGCDTVINIGSTSAFMSKATWGAYCITKAAIVALTENLAKEGFNAYCLHPARTDTKMRESLFPNEDKSTLLKPEQIAVLVPRIIKGEFPNGSQIVVKKEGLLVLPMRSGV